MAKTQILEYTIWLTDEALVTALNAQLESGNGPGLLLFYYSPALQANTFGVLRAPETGAALEFAAPFQLDTEPFLAPCTRSPWFTDGANFPTNVAKFTRKSGGWFGIPLLFGETTTFYWAGKFAFSPASVDSTDPPPVPPPALMARRWIEGFELPRGVGAVSGGGGEGGADATPNATRDSSRSIDGYGCALRSNTFANQGTRHYVMEYRGGGTSDQVWSWERFYFRPRRYGAAEVEIWACESQASNGGAQDAGFRLRMAPNGGLLVYSFSGVATLRASGPVMALDTWIKIDVVIGYNTEVNAPPTAPPLSVYGSLRVYVDGVQVMDVPHVLLNPLTSFSFRHYFSQIGPLAANVAEMDYDDWISVDCPTEEPDPGFDLRTADYALLATQTDFIGGTHCQLLQPSGVVSQVGWTGAWQLALQRPIENTGTSNRITSSTSGASLNLTADVSPAQQRGGVVGIGAVVMGWYGFRGAGAPANDTVEMELTFGVDPPITTSRSVVPPAALTDQWQSVLYDADAVDPAPILTALILRFFHGADVIQRATASLQAVAEQIGVFGPEDTADDDYPPQPPVSPHNSAYPFTPWATGGAPLFGAVAAITGSYLSAGTPLDLTFPLPVQMLWIRRTSGTAAQMRGAQWWTSLLTSHFLLEQPIIPYAVPMALRDPNFPPPVSEDDQEMQFLVRIATADEHINAAGATYAYLAICDPAARFVQCGASAHTTPFPITESLPNPNFTPEAGFFFPEDRGTTAALRVAYKGPDHAANEASLISGGALLTDYVNFGAGSLQERTNFFPANTEQTAYVLFRHSDGNDGTGSEASLFQTATYVGDGVSPRTIDLDPLFGQRPMWGIVMGPAANNGRQRDPSHTGTTSTNLETGAIVAANGIRGGDVDQIIVGSDLNANGVTYYVFVIPGCGGIGEGGWSVESTCYVVEPDSPGDPGWIEPIEIDPGGGDDVPVIPPIDFLNPERLRLAYIDRAVYFDYADTEGDGHTLLFEPLYKRWSLDLYPSGASVRVGEPGPLAHTNLIGCYNGQIYQFEESLRTDDGTGIPWVIWPMWAGGDDPRGLKQWGDAVVDLTPGGGCLVTPVAANGGVLAATTIVAGNTRQTVIIEVNSGNGVIARNFGLRIQGTQASADPSRPFLYAWEPSWLPKDVSVERRATDWDDLGYKGAKFVQGVIIRANTFNATKSVEVQYDGGTVAETLELLHNGELTVAYPIDPYGWQPFIAELVRLKGADAVPWSLLDWRWVWEPAPEAATQWETQETTFNLPGFLAVHDCLIAYMADDPVTLTVWHDNGLQMHTLPATAGAYLRYYQRLTTAKGKWARFRLTSDSPFRLFARDTSVRIQGWGIPGGYQVVQPFGGPHREVGAQI